MKMPFVNLVTQVFYVTVVPIATFAKHVKVALLFRILMMPEGHLTSQNRSVSLVHLLEKHTKIVIPAHLETSF